jgi:SWI/SNF-related matrix-associated actin-dependent regulator 1 of chromatin subfamily A
MPFDGTVRRPKAMPHQITGAAFLAARGFALLADEPGLGKTATAIVAADLCGARKILVACPGAVRAHWAREFALWQDIDRPIRIADGFLDFVPGDGVTIVSHATLADMPNPRSKRDIGKSFPNLQAGAPYDVIIVDESHVFRAYDAIRTRNLWSPAPAGLWAWTHRIWCLSGTPMVNSPADFWPIAYGPLRMQIPWWDWGIRFADQKVDASGVIKFTGLKNADELAGILRPHVLRRTLAGLGIQLPSLTISEQRMPIASEALSRALAGLEGWNPQRLAAALEDKDELHDTALASVRRALGMAKADGIAAHVDQIVRSGNGPVVVFFQHTAVRDRLFAALSPSWKVSWIDGKITPAQLGAAESWFQDGRLDVLLVQTDAGGIGLSLVRGNRCVVAELPWTSVGLWQAIKRIHRLKQTRACLAEVVRAQGCWLEDALSSAINRKHLASQSLLSLLESFE